MTTVELLCLCEILQILVIGENLDGVFRSFQVMAPCLERTNDGQEFLVLDVVIPFHVVERLREVRDRVPLTVFAFLAEDSTGGEVRGVALDSERFFVVRHEKNWRRSKRSFESLERELTILRPAPGSVLFG